MKDPIFVDTDGSASLDDAIAPALAGRRLMERIGADRGGTIHAPSVPGSFPGLLGRWKAELNVRLLDCRTGLCEHLFADVAQVMIWFVYLPELVRCTSCAAEAADAVAGTPADDICDGCGTTVVGPNMSTVTGEVTAQIRQGVATGPVLIHGGACSECAEADLRNADENWGPGQRIEKGQK